MRESLENQIHGTFIFIAFSISIVAEIERVTLFFFYVAWCIVSVDCLDPILELPPFSFSSRVGLRQVFCAN